jgi:hypothetical protein
LNHKHGEGVHDAGFPERGVNNDDAQQTKGLTANGLAKRGRRNGHSDDANREQDENTMSMQEPKKSI